MAHMTIDTSAFEAGLARAENAANLAARNIRLIMNSVSSMNGSFNAAGSAAGSAASSISSSVSNITNNVNNGTSVVNNYYRNTATSLSNSGNKWEAFSSTVSKSLKVVGVAIAAAGVAVGKLVKDSVSAYAEYEQLVGGVETLFKNASNTVINNAKNAYNTAQISANQYMQILTSFSSSLLQGIAKGQAVANAMTKEEYSEMLDNQLEAQEEALDQQYEAAKKNYSKQYDALEKSLSAEIDAYQEAMEKKIDQINKEYTERIKLIDEEKYKKIKAIEEQIEAINDEAEAESYLSSQQEYETKKAELEDTIAHSRKRKKREAAKQELAELEEKWNQKEKERARKQQIESLNEEKDAIKEKADAQKEALKAEQEEKVNAIKESEKAQLKAMKEAKKEQLEALKESNDAQLKALKKRYDEEIKMAKKAAKKQLAAYEEGGGVGDYTEEQYAKAAEIGNRAVIDMADKMLVRIKRVELYQRCEAKRPQEMAA